VIDDVSGRFNEQQQRESIAQHCLHVQTILAKKVDYRIPFISPDVSCGLISEPAKAFMCRNGDDKDSSSAQIGSKLPNGLFIVL
jgi:hypothetical protein